LVSIGGGKEIDRASLHRAHFQFLRQLKNPLRLCRRTNVKLDRHKSATRQRGRHDRKHFDPWNLHQSHHHRTDKRFGRFRANAPRLQHHSGEAAFVRRRDLEREIGFRKTVENFPGGVRERLQLIKGRVGRRINEAKDHPLIFCRR